MLGISLWYYYITNEPIETPGTEDIVPNLFPEDRPKPVKSKVMGCLFELWRRKENLLVAKYDIRRCTKVTCTREPLKGNGHLMTGKDSEDDVKGDSKFCLYLCLWRSQRMLAYQLGLENTQTAQLQRGKDPPKLRHESTCWPWAATRNASRRNPSGWAILDLATEVVMGFETLRFGPYWAKERAVREARFDHIKP